MQHPQVHGATLLTMAKHVKYADKWHLVDEASPPEQLPLVVGGNPRQPMVLRMQCCSARPPVGRMWDAPIDSAPTCTGD